MVVTITITHWLPIMTFCPVNNLPDFIFIEVEFHEFAELYAVRKQLKKFKYKKLFMEDIAKQVYEEFPSCACVTVRLMFNKHIVKIRRLQCI